MAIQAEKGVKHMQDVFEQMEEKWPSAIVSRSEIKAFTGGVISGSYLANLDAAGEGPPRVKVGRQKWGYPVKSLVVWLRDRSQFIGKQ